MPRALHQDEVLVGSHPRERIAHATPEVVVHAAHHEVGREVPRKGDRAHVIEGIGEVEDLLMSTASSSARVAVHHEIALPDRLHEAQPQPALENRGDEASDTVVLPRFCPVAARKMRCADAGRRSAGHA